MLQARDKFARNRPDSFSVNVPGGSVCLAQVDKVTYHDAGKKIMNMEVQ